jgi:hypothetical protein
VSPAHAIAFCKQFFNMHGLGCGQRLWKGVGAINVQHASLGYYLGCGEKIMHVARVLAHSNSQLRGCQISFAPFSSSTFCCASWGRPVHTKLVPRWLTCGSSPSDFVEIICGERSLLLLDVAAAALLQQCPEASGA